MIILLGGGIIDKVPDLSGFGIPSDDMLGRIVTAVRLQKKLHVPIIVSGGKVYKRGSAEAHIVKRFLVDLGVAESRIIVEDKSRNTFKKEKYRCKPIFASAKLQATKKGTSGHAAIIVGWTCLGTPGPVIL